jgi:hypothetical protein
MPRVPTYRRQIQETAQPAARRAGVPVVQVDTPQIRHSPSPASKGAGFGEDLARVGQQLLQQQLQLREEEKQRQNTTAALDADRQLGENVLGYLDDPEKGVLAKRGKDAFGLHETADPQFEKWYGEIYESLSNDDQKQMFYRMANSRRENFKNRIAAHEGREYESFAASSLAAGNALSVAGAAANFDHPEEIGTERERIRLRIWNYGTERGKGAEWIKAATQAELTKLHVAIIDGYLAKGLDREAEVYYKNPFHLEEIAGDARANIEKQLDLGSVAGAASRAAAQIWAKLGPKSDSDTVSMDVLASAIRDQFKNDPDPKSRRANTAIQELRQLKGEFEDGRQARREGTESAVWQMVLSGAGLTDIQRSTEYRNLPGQVQRAISEHVADRMYTLDQRAKSAREFLKDQAWQEESRTRTRESWAKSDKDEKAYSRYEDILSDPDSFARMSENAILTELPVLGKTLTNDLLTKRRQMTADRSVSASIESDIFNQVAEDGGLDPFKSKKSDAEKARLGSLRKYVLDQIDFEQRSTGNKELSRERKRQIMEEALVEVVPSKGLFFKSPEKRVFEAGLEEIRSTRNVNLIPLAERQQIEQALIEKARQEEAAGGRSMRITDDMILRAYIQYHEGLKK